MKRKSTTKSPQVKRIRTSPPHIIQEQQASVRVTPPLDITPAEAAEDNDPISQNHLKAVSVLSIKPITPTAAEEINPRTGRSPAIFRNTTSFFNLTEMIEALPKINAPEKSVSSDEVSSDEEGHKPITID